MRSFEPFLDHAEVMQFKTQKIGDGLDRPEDITRSHFTNVSEHVEYVFTNVERDLRTSFKNIEYLKECINKIDEKSREDLSTVTKEIGNKIIFLYDNMAASINDQRSENLHLQLELANLTKEKNTLRHEIKNLIHGVRKMEIFLGVDKDPWFDNMVENNKFS